jgi:hypothetical protein
MSTKEHANESVWAGIADWLPAIVFLITVILLLALSDVRCSVRIVIDDTPVEESK